MPRSSRLLLAALAWLTIVAPAAGKLSGTAVKSGRTLAKGSATVKQAGKKVSLRLKATKSGKKRLRGKVTIKVTFRPKSGKAITSSKTLTLR